MRFFRMFQHLLPNAKAWRLTTNKRLRQFFEGLTGVGSDVKQHVDLILLDLFPETTREISSWEQQWGLPNTGLSESDRRDRLSSVWKSIGGQSPRYIQDTLQARGFEVYVHEWWEPSVEHPTGGSVNGDVSPTVRNPNLYLDDGGAARFVMIDGAESAQDGDDEAQDGATLSPVGYPLVNKILVGSDTLIGDGSLGMQDGDDEAQDGGKFAVYSQVQYDIPTDPTKWPYFLYIGGSVFPDTAIVPESRRDEFEDLCLQICPTEAWLGILVVYN